MRRFADAFLLLGLVGLPGAAPGQAERNSSVAELASIWISACLDGRLQLSPDGIREVSAREMEAYWEPERRQRNARYFKIRQPAEAGLIITDYDPPTPDGFKSTCQLISRTHDLKPGWPLIAKALGGASNKTIPGMDVYTVEDRAEGYRIEVHSWMFSLGHFTDRIVRDARAHAKKPTASAEESPFE